MKEILENQYKNLFLWVPFILAFGSAFYFSLDVEPIFHFPIIITTLIGIIIYKYKNVFVRALFLFVFGFFYAMSFTQIVNTPQIKDSFGFIPIDAVVRDVNFTNDSTRILLSIPSNQIDKKLSHKNINIRVSLKDSNKIPNIGDKVSGKLMIFHPAAKYTPNGFDFSRWAYFHKISGTGFFQEYKIIKSDNKNLRAFIHNKSNSILTDALVLGYKNVIPENENRIWKSVGIGHVWSISGFHMTLIGGWLFALFYLLFRAIPYITKRIPAKYLSIICAWFGLIFYLCISGISIATLRAFLMTTLIFIATILGRSVLSLRNAVLAFLIIFFTNPYSIMNAGFQLSFAAIFGLLWFFDDNIYIKRTKISRVIHYIYLSFLTTLIATIFTLPCIIAHFGNIPIYSLIGNIVLLPIFSLAIMPLVIIGTILAIFGNHFVLNITNNVYDFALLIATQISELPHANLSIPGISNTILSLIIIGFLFLILTAKTDTKNFILRNINYVLCIICISCATLIYINQQSPLFYATNDHVLVAFNVNNKLEFNKSRASKHYFAFDTWYAFNDQEKPIKNKRYKCDHGFCIYNTKNWNLVYMQTFTSIMDNMENVCNNQNIDYIVTTFEIKSTNCHGKVLQNGLLIYPSGKIIEIINQRPWHNPPA